VFDKHELRTKKKTFFLKQNWGKPNTLLGLGWAWPIHFGWSYWAQGPSLRIQVRPIQLGWPDKRSNMLLLFPFFLYIYKEK
jgi:hypothetical protein